MKIMVAPVLTSVYVLSWEHTWARTGLHCIAPHQIVSVCRCEQYKRPGAYTPNNAHMLCETDSIVGPSEWALFSACSVWTAFFVVSIALAENRHFYVTLNKILLSSVHIGSATYVPHAHTFAFQTRTALNYTIWSAVVRIFACSSVFQALQNLLAFTELFWSSNRHHVGRLKQWMEEIHQYQSCEYWSESRGKRL